MKYVLVVFSIVILASCNWFKEKTKATVNRGGEIVGKAGSEFVNGVTKGVEKTYTNKLVVSDELKSRGVKTGKVIISSSDSSRDNVVTAYLIFDKDIDADITAKVFTETGDEYGRVTESIKGKRNDARYVDFVFDKRTNIDAKDQITLE